MVDTLADGGEEGRARLRKVLGSCQEALIQKYPNGATQHIVIYVTPYGERTRGSETSQYPQEKKSNEIPKVAASEIGLGQTSCLQLGFGLQYTR